MLRCLVRVLRFLQSIAGSKKEKKRKNVMKSSMLWRMYVCHSVHFTSFASKKVMRNLCIFVVIGFVALSCGLSEIGGGIDEEGGIWGGPVEVVGGGAGAQESICYMTGVDYVRGYDWRSDQARESVKCSLVVYVDGSPIMKVPVGREEQVCADADMHRIIGGSLYTDYATDTETVIKKNGQLLFRYDSPERISDMIVKDEDVFTLGENRNGSGFSLRKNGEIVISRENGALTAPLRMDGDSLCFGFSEPIRTATGTIERYYAVYGRTVTNLSLREDLKKVWDVFTVDGKVVCLALLQAMAQPVIIKGEDIKALNLAKGLTMISCSMFKVGNGIAVEGMCKSTGGAFKSGIWIDCKPLVMFDNMNISSICTDGTGVCCVLNSSDTNTSGIIYRCGEVFQMPAGYSCMGAQSLAMVNGILNVGLSSLSGDRPLLWKDGQVEIVSINGYISGVSAY